MHMTGAAEQHKEEKRDITFRVFRFNPQVDIKPYFDDYTIPVERGITVLRALNYIKEHVDPTVSYRAFCQAGICGSCGMRVNGISKLACTTQVWDELDRCKEPGILRVEPLRNMPPIKDLIVDMDPLVDKMKHYMNWVDSSMPESEMGKKEFLVSEDEFLKYDKATDCILCASCVSECTILRAHKEYVSPAVLLKSYRMNVDSRDSIHDTRLAELVKDHGVWDCTHCYRCQETCVKSIPIMMPSTAYAKTLWRSEEQKTPAARNMPKPSWMISQRKENSLKPPCRSGQMVCYGHCRICCPWQ